MFLKTSEIHNEAGSLIVKKIYKKKGSLKQPAGTFLPKMGGRRGGIDQSPFLWVLFYFITVDSLLSELTGTGSSSDREKFG